MKFKNYEYKNYEYKITGGRGNVLNGRCCYFSSGPEKSKLRRGHVGERTNSVAKSNHFGEIFEDQVKINHYRAERR